MAVQFTKMHGLGNDFVVIDAISQPFEASPERCRAIADRRFGVGCDQLLLVEPPRQPETEFYYRIFNADGSEVEQCGNGARCFARFVRDKGLTPNDVIDVGTAAGPIRLYLEQDGLVRVNMGAPRLEPASLPFVAQSRAASYALDLDGQRIEFAAVSMGNPHMVLRVDDVEQAAVETLGPSLECHPLFPKRVNVGFMEIQSRSRIRLRVFERGAGETLACGTGACAAAVAGRLQGELEERVEVALPAGSLFVEWAGEGEPVWMTGPAVTVFEGSLP
jgi:diaminopimelate epimerase